jgi:hypothetical protein
MLAKLSTDAVRSHCELRLRLVCPASSDETHAWS